MSDLSFKFKVTLNISDYVLKIIDYTTIPLVHIKSINFLYDEILWTQFYYER